MQIGILQCDNVRSTLSPLHGEYPQMFEAAFHAVESPDEIPLSFTTYAAHNGVLPEALDECDAYVITGSRFSVLESEELWINQLQNFIVRLSKANIKTIGVCFGHQIMAIALGGKVERADCGWQIGVHENQIVHYADFMQPKTGAFHVPMLCEDQVVKVGETATVLAEGKNCEYAMLQYGENMLSLQGHPEFTLDFAKALLTVRQEEFPKKRFNDGIESFSETALDGELLFIWFLRFFTQDLAAKKTDEKPVDATA